MAEELIKEYEDNATQQHRRPDTVLEPVLEAISSSSMNQLRLRVQLPVI